MCGGAARDRYSVETGPPLERRLDVALCSRCGLLFASTPLSDADLERLYAAGDSAAYHHAIAETNAEKMARSVTDLAPVWRRRLDVRVLDIGCGDGRLLDEVKARHPRTECAGYELDEATADLGRARGHRILTGPLADLREQFTVVTMLDVAEHVRDPVAVFTDCRRLLEGGGLLYLHTPRRCWADTLALLAPRLARSWLRSRVSAYHLQLWSDRALRVALHSAGFRSVTIQRASELSWPVARYVKVYLFRDWTPPRWLERATVLLATVLLRAMRNKAICVARVD